MTLPHICPYCGSATDVPQLFTRTRQKIFFYVWNNPNCTQLEIGMAIYPNQSPSAAQNRISTHLRDIRLQLDSGNEYTLHITRAHFPWRYKIIHQRTPQESLNATNQRNRGVS